MKQIIKNILFGDRNKPNVFWISFPEYFNDEEEREKFLKRTVKFLYRKTKINNKTTYA